jgi:molybdopterin/thiamine biosynthesis adenylyltransferase
MKVRVIGCGGIGTALLPVLCRFLHYHPKFKDQEIEVSLIDGDTFEERNRERQTFNALGNKAEVTREDLQKQFPNIYFRAHPTYIDEDNIILMIREDDVVFSAVDNHDTRKCLSDHCESLQNVLLISGGNDYYDGNIQVHHRKDGVNLTLPIANEFHMEISEPEDENPARKVGREGGCDVEVVHEPQLVIANNNAANLMLNAFYGYLEGGLDYDEVYFDVAKNSFRKVKRTRN